eukprot:3687338-Rhodomonas_salina.3
MPGYLAAPPYAVSGTDFSVSCYSQSGRYLRNTMRGADLACCATAQEKLRRRGQAVYYSQGQGALSVYQPAMRCPVPI